LTEFRTDHDGSIFDPDAPQSAGGFNSERPDEQFSHDGTLYDPAASLYPPVNGQSSRPGEEETVIDTDPVPAKPAWGGASASATQDPDSYAEKVEKKTGQILQGVGNEAEYVFNGVSGGIKKVGQGVFDGSKKVVNGVRKETEQIINGIEDMF
jgi:hypothetical protein